MRSYEEISKRIMQKGDEIIETRKIRSTKIKHTSYAVSGICASAVLGIGLWHISKLNLENDEKLSDNKIITETTETTSTYQVPTVTTETTSDYTTAIHTDETTSTAFIITETKTAVTTTSNVTQTNSPLTTNVTTAISTTADTTQNTSVQTTATTSPTITSSSITTTAPSEIELPTTTNPDTEPLFFEKFPTIWLDDPAESFDKPKVLRFCTNNIPKDRIGSFIRSEHITNRCTNSDANFSETDIELYELENVSPYTAIIVKFIETGDLGIYINTMYQPDTLGDLIDELNLSADDFSVNSVIGTLLWELMISDTSLPNVIGQCKAEGIILINEISFNMQISSIGSICFFGITKDGYIYTNSAPQGAAFYIGADKAEEIISFVAENVI